ncbi:DUF58 domain-containing protein [Anaerotruncus rubiinfantis]|uniref:DUF58 domain-containing protein n=1 Tax=Anaerotruncus rubiinfantis TaxID=1720200 RepID=UPI001896D40C|nr:DUF58 domain-containing protein [Anaerotruncus rubiinfantis]
MAEELRKEKKQRIAGLSSVMVSAGFLAGVLVAICLAVLGGQMLLAAFLLFVLAICLMSRFWGQKALKNVIVEIGAESANIFAGQEVVIRYRITNGKLLPLVWLELLQQTPPNNCLTPGDDFEVYELTVQEKELEDREVVRTLLKKKFAFIMWHQTLEWDSCWTARRRGIYPLDHVLLRSGDGFGLTQIEKPYPVERSPVFVVYPRIVPVRTDLFLQNLWDAKSGAKGYFEDPTVIRGERAYQSTDPWKRINWRMAARKEELEVKLYETIMPKSVHFILDGGSFLNRSPDNEELEQAINLLASAALRLEEAQVRCGLSLPASRSMGAVNLFSADQSAAVSDLLFNLAGYDPESPASAFEEAELARAKEGIGQVYFFTYDVAEISCKGLLDELGIYSVTLVPYREYLPSRESGAEFLDYKVVPLHTLEGGGAHG